MNSNHLARHATTSRHSCDISRHSCEIIAIFRDLLVRRVVLAKRNDRHRHRSRRSSAVKAITSATEAASPNRKMAASAASHSSSRRSLVQTLLLKVLSRCNASADHHHTALCYVLCCALLPPTVGSLRPNARLSPQPSSYWLSCAPLSSYSIFSLSPPHFILCPHALHT